MIVCVGSGVEGGGGGGGGRGGERGREKERERGFTGFTSRLLFTDKG